MIYLATDLGGSVRLATSGSDTVVGAASYDAWGTARPTTSDAAGQTLLAAMQAATPFGYAGQLYDAGLGASDASGSYCRADRSQICGERAAIQRLLGRGRQLANERDPP